MYPGIGTFILTSKKNLLATILFKKILDINIMQLCSLYFIWLYKIAMLLQREITEINVWKNIKYCIKNQRYFLFIKLFVFYIIFDTSPYIDICTSTLYRNICTSMQLNRNVDIQHLLREERSIFGGLSSAQPIRDQSVKANLSKI